MKRDHVSFDVFDTCLIRRCGLPYKIWDLMADKLFDKEDDRGRLSFVGNRSLAEKKVNQRILHPTLSDIYDELDVTQWGFEKEQVMNLEMEIEEQELFPNPEMLKIVDEYREKGFIIEFISDMYLPTEFIKKNLMKFGFCKEGERVYVSAECKAEKYDGRLFDFVLKETGTKPKQWIHYGDNERSDYRIPKSKGIKANFVNNTSFTDEERRWIDEARFYMHKHEIELWTGLCRLTRLQNEQSFAATMAVDFIASVYVPYVVWVLKTAKAKGIKTLYFLARDSHIFLEIAKALKAESDGIECRYLKVSRRVLHACAFYDVDDYELALTVENARNQTVKNALKYIGLDYKTLSDATKEKFAENYSLCNKKRRCIFSESLKKNDKELIKRTSKEKRSLFLSYLHQEKFFEQKSAMVDLGWIGSCRCIVNHILRKEGFSSIPTFYFGYNSELIYGNTEDLLYIYNKQFDVVHMYSCGNLFFEEYASLNSNGTTIGYKQENDTIIPIESEENKSLRWIASLNEAIVVDVCKKIEAIKSIDSSAFDEIFYLCGLNQMVHTLAKPSNKHIKFFKEIDFENYTIVNKMVRRIPIKDIFALLIWGLPASMIWLEAAIIVTFGPFSGLFKKAYAYTSSTAFANKLRLWWENRR